MTIKFKPIQTTVEVIIESEHLEEPCTIVMKKPSHIDVRFQYSKMQLQLQQTLKESGLTTEDFSNKDLSVNKITLLEEILKAQVEMVKVLSIGLSSEDIEGLTTIGVIPQIIEKYNNLLVEDVKIDAEKKS